MEDRRAAMRHFWSDRVKRFGVDPRSNTNDVWLREVEISSIQKVIDEYRPARILDFGCANGYTTCRLAEKYADGVFVGLDINEDMIASALSRDLPDNLSFRQGDVLVDDIRLTFDLIIAVRAFQNIENYDLQLRVFDKLQTMLARDGLFFFIESYVDGYEQLNHDRMDIGLAPLPIQPHLTLLTEAFDQHVGSVLDRVERGSPSSSYYLITRLVYSKLASISGETIDYGHPLHQLAAAVPQIGNYGPQESGLYRKRERS